MTKVESDAIIITLRKGDIFLCMATTVSEEGPGWLFPALLIATTLNLYKDDQKYGH